MWDKKGRGREGGDGIRKRNEMAEGRGEREQRGRNGKGKREGERERGKERGKRVNGVGKLEENGRCRFRRQQTRGSGRNT